MHQITCNTTIRFRIAYLLVPYACKAVHYTVDNQVSLLIFVTQLLVGTTKHEETSHSAFDSVFKFIDEKYKELSDKK